MQADRKESAVVDNGDDVVLCSSWAPGLRISQYISLIRIPDSLVTCIFETCPFSLKGFMLSQCWYPSEFDIITVLTLHQHVANYCFIQPSRSCNRKT